MEHWQLALWFIVAVMALVLLVLGRIAVRLGEILEDQRKVAGWLSYIANRADVHGRDNAKGQDEIVRQIRNFDGPMYGILQAAKKAAGDRD